VEVSALQEIIQATPRERFITERPYLFLVVSSRGSEADADSFDTVVPGLKSKTQGRTMKVMVVEKAPGNPWPDRVSVGRARNCDVNIREPSVSKLHGHFYRRESGFDLVDLGSQNGTCINGRPLAANRGEPVQAGDVLLFGGVSCKLLSAAQLYDLFK
jgi:pSer/pThr/pTyr-binding forkhead associated (FHA) protein